MTLCRLGLHEHPGEGRCRPCHLARMAAWRRANPERYRARVEAWRLNNREHLMQYRREYYYAHRERTTLEARAWHERHRAHRLAQMAQWRRRGSLDWWLEEIGATCESSSAS